MKKLCLYILLNVLFSLPSTGQKSIDQKEKKQVIDSAMTMLNKAYVFPDVATKMTELISKNFELGIYNSITDPRVFCEKITQDLRSISHDKHLHLGYSHDRSKQLNNDKEIVELENRRLKLENYGFSEIKVLKGNVGYLKFDYFNGSKEGFDIASAAMNYLSNTSAIIIDLRDNIGGSPEMIQVIASYLFDSKPIHLNSFYYRENDLTTQSWTLPVVSGKRNPFCLVYVLTSNRTFSAAEEFTYDLKNLKRATIVGETTAGGAHPVTFKIINDNFIISLPYGRAINPITKTNWQGTGIEPNIKVIQDKAFETAYLEALKEIHAKETNELFKESFQWIIYGIDAKLNPIGVTPELLLSYVGTYGPRSISMENNSLYHQREGLPKYKLIALKDDYFSFEGELDDFRLRFIKEGKKIIAVEGCYYNGQKNRYEKIK